MLEDVRRHERREDRDDDHDHEDLDEREAPHAAAGRPGIRRDDAAMTGTC